MAKFEILMKFSLKQLWVLFKDGTRQHPRIAGSSWHPRVVPFTLLLHAGREGGVAWREAMERSHGEREKLGR